MFRIVIRDCQDVIHHAIALLSQTELCQNVNHTSTDVTGDWMPMGSLPKDVPLLMLGLRRSLPSDVKISLEVV